MRSHLSAARGPCDTLSQQAATAVRVPCARFGTECTALDLAGRAAVTAGPLWQEQKNTSCQNPGVWALHAVVSARHALKSAHAYMTVALVDQSIVHGRRRARTTPVKAPSAASCVAVVVPAAQNIGPTITTALSCPSTWQWQLCLCTCDAADSYSNLARATPGVPALLCPGDASFSLTLIQPCRRLKALAPYNTLVVGFWS